MFIVRQNLPGRSDNLAICLQMEPAFARLSEDDRHETAALMMSQTPGVLSAFPDPDGPDGYAMVILKGAKKMFRRKLQPGGTAQFPLLQSEIHAANLSALFGDDRKERRKNLRSYLRRRHGLDLPTEMMESAKAYFDRYDHLYERYKGVDDPFDVLVGIDEEQHHTIVQGCITVTHELQNSPLPVIMARVEKVFAECDVVCGAWGDEAEPTGIASGVLKGGALLLDLDKVKVGYLPVMEHRQRFEEWTDRYGDGRPMRLRGV
jgi:hypothetical protein